MFFSCSLRATASAQVSTASVNGVIRDPKGAVIPGANIVLASVDTSVEHTSVSNGSGEYVFLNITPGRYTLSATAQGFNPQKVAEFVLAVSQIATFDFTLTVGTETQVVTVEGNAAQLDVTSATLGTVIATKQVNDLPLDGRNFTTLLSLTPGVVPIMTGQSNGMQNNGGFGAAVAIGSDYTFPSINGQTNRSDFFLMDGLYNYGAIESTYAVAPIIDAIQEFKVVSHTDDAEFGSVLGGVVNVVTKTGTNNLHGSGWEYLRNTVFDARNYFLPTTSPKAAYHQNQFGGRPGRSRPDSEAIQRQEQDLLLRRLSGFPIFKAREQRSAGAYCGGVGWQRGRQSANRKSTILMPQRRVGTGFTRPAFPGNQIPAALIDPRMVAYAKFVFPAAGPFFGTPNSNGAYPANAIDTTPLTQVQNEFDVRGRPELRGEGLGMVPLQLHQ